MPCLRGMAPTMMHTSMLLKATAGSAVVDTSAAGRGRVGAWPQAGRGSLTLEEREGTVLKFHDDPLHDLHHGWDVQEEELDWLVHAKHVTTCQGIEEGVRDLAGSTGDADTQRLKREKEKDESLDCYCADTCNN